MDALELLKTDHLRVLDLFKEYDTSGSARKQRVVFENIRNELEDHGYIEETVFYPVFGKYDEFRSIVEKSYQDHRLVRAMLTEIDAIRDHGPKAVERMRDLRASVEAHVHEEETTLFPRIRQLMKRNEREQLGRHLQAARHERRESSAA